MQSRRLTVQSWWKLSHWRPSNEILQCLDREYPGLSRPRWEVEELRLLLETSGSRYIDKQDDMLVRFDFALFAEQVDTDTTGL